MELKIKHAPNPDIRGGYWSAIKRPNNVVFQVASLEEASEKCREFISAYDIGGGNWCGGVVRDNAKKVAVISYNGRIWTEGEYFNRSCNLPPLECLKKTG